jgi:hypothetical protein
MRPSFLAAGNRLIEKLILWLRDHIIFKSDLISRCFSTIVLSNSQWPVWTSSSPDYAETVVEQIFLPDQNQQLQFVWASDRSARRFDSETHESCWVKNLRKVRKKGFPLDSVLMIDDSPASCSKIMETISAFRPIPVRLRMTDFFF